jgi:uncharacterized membrane protein YeaQ/YmgE (transglycosylase-associated protein family)
MSFVALASVLMNVPSTAAAHPPHSAGHGVNQTTACTLWAGDTDLTNRTEYDSLVENDTSELCALAPLTDIPLDTPPKAVEEWNEGEAVKFGGTGSGRTEHPDGVTRHDGRFIRDAAVAIFAIQPSTRAHLSPSDKPLYVASQGRIFGTMDYRVRIPDDDSDGSHRTYWTLRSHSIRETSVEINDNAHQTAGGSQAPDFEFDLSGVAGGAHELGLSGEIRVLVHKRTQRCVGIYDTQNNTCSDWEQQSDLIEDRVIVGDARRVVEYNLSVAGYRTAYPNGDWGLLVFKNRPWLGYSLPNGDVRGVWRFYVARDENWDTLTTRSENGKTRRHSPMHPLQVHAFPVETGSTPDPTLEIEILEAFGGTESTPTLDSDVQLDIVDEPYTRSYGLATRIRTKDHDFRAVTAYGLVRGSEISVDSGMLSDVELGQSNLTLDIQNQSANTVTVSATLVDDETGHPINTDGREGFVVLQGKRVNTTGKGTVTSTLTGEIGGVSARYVPGKWWYSPTSYTGDTAVASVHGAEIVLMSILFEVGVPLSLLFLAWFIIGRMTGWDVWPPWRLG